MTAMSSEVNELVARAQAEASSLSHDYVGAVHILFAILDSAKSREIISSLDVAPEELHRRARKSIRKGHRHVSGSDPLPLTTRATAALQNAALQAADHGIVELRTEDVLVGLAMVSDSLASRAMKSVGLTADKLQETVY